MKTKTIIVTGASSGIGFDIAKALHEDGHTVIGCSRTYPKTDYLWDHKICDVEKEASVMAFYKSFIHDYTHIDGIIHSAGMGIGGALEDTSYHKALKLHQINVLGPFLLTQIFLPLLRESTQAKIINIGSVAGDITLPFQVFYSMSKSSLSRLTEGLRYELKPFGIDVSIINPGDTKTNFTTNRQVESNASSLYKDRVKRSIDKMAEDELKGKPTQSVVNVVRKQLKRRKMKPAVTVGFSYKCFILLNKILPTKLKEHMIYKRYGK
ncbi:MAG: SDR family NAD(P)-dependent oxidoreductase [Bacillota bacterium]